MGTFDRVCGIEKHFSIFFSSPAKKMTNKIRQIERLRDP